MKKNYKGFTLVELLAVVVILAIIALIAIPGVQKITDNARKTAFLGTAHGILRAGQQYYSEKILVQDDFSEKTFEFPTHVSELEFNGELPESGSMIIDEEGNISIAVSNGRYCARKGKQDRNIVISELEEECYIYEDTTLNGANPELVLGMIPVIIDDDGTVTKTSTTSKWHDYANKKWANVVTVTEETRAMYQDAEIGTVIKEKDILTYLVWIPRYKYRLWNVSNTGTSGVDTNQVHSINIVFENKNTTKSQGTSNGTYLTHPAFTFGEEELNGFWIGKFEPGYSGATSISSARVTTANSNKVVIKPNAYSWSGINVSNAYKTVKGMNASKNVFGFGDDSDPHMMKNIEWGAVAYLSHSRYGKNGEVYINNKNGVTGCGGNSGNEATNSTCLNAYGTKVNGVYNQSTTGNITGIFDMSGGRLEYVMGYTTSATTTYGSSGFTAATFPEDKYVDIYSSTNNTQYSNRILGDATGEMGPFNNSFQGSWYNDYANFVDNNVTWVARGGYHGASGDNAGLFGFFDNSGAAIPEYSFRVVIV